ncbi:DUF6781 family protein [Methylomonas koyamae]|uniref:Uncharacterized protein n=1 Tax=Methylomonas koyamae TaxID=702114 RepID=A0AA91I557_9GAMM|nr:DUF6781 family protein [Methylomonas koyamae]OAI25791.1 hypothetical protein A1356_12945 [Methylomonas koyamae]
MSTENTQNTKNTARDTVIQGNNIKNEIRAIVVQALTEGTMSPDVIKQTLSEVIEGACEGARIKPNVNAEALKQVVTGIDVALSQVAEASKLAIEEATGNIQAFSDHDLKQAMNDLQDLESMFLDTLNEVAGNGKETAHQTLRDLLNHIQSTGSSVGQSVNNILSGLHRDLAKDGRLQNIQAADIVKATGATIATVASGILAGIADSLKLEDQ